MAMDVVPIKAGRTKGAGRKTGHMKQTYFWPLYGDSDEVAFTWSNSRGMLHAQAQLQDLTGTLLTDGYAAYTKTVAQINQQEQQIVHAACWVHMRRGFEKALNSEPHTAQQALDIIATLYRHEKHIRHKQLDLADIHAYRQQHSEPLVTDFFRRVYQRDNALIYCPNLPSLRHSIMRMSEKANLKYSWVTPPYP